MRDESVLKKFSALYVEDNKLMRDSIGRIIRRRFGEVYIAENGKEGLELYIKYKPNIVITDVEMPVMDGITMIKKIRAVKETQSIIITTAYEDDEHTDSSCVNLIKPVEAERLIDAIFECLGCGR
ncbi:MAG: response regulator [Nitrospirae bacterium]|nr:response regulator [Nitrospirota bacterium]